MAYSKLILAVMLSLSVSGCAFWQRKQVELPKTELPRKPVSTDIPCEDLVKQEEEACSQQGAEAKEVCRKVQKNKLICDDQQAFVKRLYEKRDGK